MVIMVLGADGQAGSATRRESAVDLQNKWFFFGRKEADITDRENLIEIARQIQPDNIINFAALTNVDELESDPESAYSVNGYGAENAAEAADSVSARLIHVSTDYVFEGSGIRENGRIRPYKESDPTNPQTVYGKSKLLGEQLIQSKKSRHLIIRTAWLYGGKNCFVSEILKQAQEGRVIRVVNDQTGSPTFVDELARAICCLIPTDISGLFHGSCQGQVTRYELARYVLSQVKSDCEIEPVPTVSTAGKAKRPAYSVLDNHSLNQLGIYQFSRWEDAMLNYLDDHPIEYFI
jgi:dTDP-4-dehydrorhamnose reductase